MILRSLFFIISLIAPLCLNATQREKSPKKNRISSIGTQSVDSFDTKERDKEKEKTTSPKTSPKRTRVKSFIEDKLSLSKEEEKRDKSPTKSPRTLDLLFKKIYRQSKSADSLPNRNTGSLDNTGSLINQNIESPNTTGVTPYYLERLKFNIEKQLETVNDPRDKDIKNKLALIVLIEEWNYQLQEADEEPVKVEYALPEVRTALEAEKNKRLQRSVSAGNIRKSRIISNTNAKK